eukprot:335711-Rhodomonas_salina.3
MHTTNCTAPVLTCSATCKQADSARLFQVLVNLMGNAIRFTSKGHIKVSGRRVSHTQRPAVELSVSGHVLWGVEEEEQEEEVVVVEEEEGEESVVVVVVEEEEFRSAKSKRAGR